MIVTFESDVNKVTVLNMDYIQSLVVDHGKGRVLVFWKSLERGCTEYVTTNPHGLLLQLAVNRPEPKIPV